MTQTYLITYSLPIPIPQKNILSVLPAYKVENTHQNIGRFNTKICGSLKGFTFKAYKLLDETINKNKNNPKAEFFAPNNYLDLEQGWHVVYWKPPPMPPKPSCASEGQMCGLEHSITCCSSLKCSDNYSGMCHKK